MNRLERVIAPQEAATVPPVAVAPEAADGPAARTRARREGARWIGIVVPAAILALWELAARLAWVPPLLFPAPSQVIRTLVGLMTTGVLPGHLAVSFKRIGLGFLAGALPGVVLGLTMGWSLAVRLLLDPTIAALYSIPRLALFPLVMLIFGIGESSMVALIAFAFFFPTLINAMAGVRSIHEMYFDVARSYGATPWKVFSRVVLPGSLPMVFTGLRLALGHSLVLVIGVEFIAARTGIGAFLWLAWETFRTTHVYVGLLVSALLGVVFTVVLRRAERQFLPWAEGLLHR